MKIAGDEIGGAHRPYIIAEISGNHCGDLGNAIKLIVAAKQAGADAVKTQCYEPGTMTLDCKKLDFIVRGGLWKGRTLYELYAKACTPFAWHKELYDVARSEGITIFSSVFDRTSVDLLESLGCPAYKIASFEIVDTPLLQYVSQTTKPIIISTGLAHDSEIIAAAEATSSTDTAFLHCTSDYPGTVETADLGRIAHIGNLLGFRHPVGISDHTLGLNIPVAATALRSAIIEKHLKLHADDIDMKSEDDAFSLNPLMFRFMVDAVTETHEALKPRAQSASPSRQFRRSLYAVKDISEGEVLTEDNVRSIRPGFGMEPKMLPKMLGKKAKRNYRRGDPLTL